MGEACNSASVGYDWWFVVVGVGEVRRFGFMTYETQLMERAKTIHLYTSTPTLTCEGEDKSTCVETQR
jgi:hypothetical protein